MLCKIIDENWFSFKVVVGFWFVNSVGDDISFWIGEDCVIECVMLYILWQQIFKWDGCFNVVLFDFVVLIGQDYVGGFVVIVGIEEDDIVCKFDEVNDNYLLIMVKVLVDCFVEVFVEWMYEYVCIELWGYVIEDYSLIDLICEFYDGICFVFGYLV